MCVCVCVCVCVCCTSTITILQCTVYSVEVIRTPPPWGCGQGGPPGEPPAAAVCLEWRQYGKAGQGGEWGTSRSSPLNHSVDRCMLRHYNTVQFNRVLYNYVCTYITEIKVYSCVLIVLSNEVGPSQLAEATQFSGTRLKVNENLADVSTVMLQSSLP